MEASERRPRPRPVAAAVLALAVTLTVALTGALAGCSSSDSGDTEAEAEDTATRDRVRAAAAATRAAGTARMAATITVEGGETTIAGEGTTDLAADVGELSLDLSDFGLRTVDALFSGARIFARNPLGVIPGLDDWIGSDLAQLAALAGIDDPALGPVEQLGFLTTLDYLGGATDVVEVGPETLRGTETTRYGVRIDLDAAAETAGEPAATELHQAARSAAEGGLAADVWLDAEGRVRQVIIAAGPAGEGDQGGQGAATLVLELHGFGLPVEVDLPDPGDVGDLLDLLD